MIGISVVAFVVVNLTGDPVRVILGADASPQQVEAVRHEMGLDRPLWAQYFVYQRALLTGRGRLGNSFTYQQPAIELVVERLPATLELALAAMLVNVAVAVPLGVVSAVRRGS